MNTKRIENAIQKLMNQMFLIKEFHSLIDWTLNKNQRRDWDFKKAGRDLIFRFNYYEKNLGSKFIRHPYLKVLKKEMKIFFKEYNRTAGYLKIYLYSIKKK